MVDVIIVNWNSGKHLAESIISIKKHHADLIKAVIVVDNASMDNSIELLEGQAGFLPFCLQIIRNKKNRGFAKACNQGAAISTNEYLLFLNPDVQLFESSLTKPISFMQQATNRDIGICGIRLVDEKGNTSVSAANFPTLRVMTGKILGLAKLFPSVFPKHILSPFDLRGNVQVDQVIGAFFLIRKNVFDQCGGFDERFFVYFEEVDLSLRAKKLGYSSFFLAEASSFHKGGGCSDQVKADRLFYSLRSRIYYAEKHYSPVEFCAIVVLTFLELPLRFLQGMMKLSWSNIKYTFAAYTRLVVYFIKPVWIK